MQDNLRKQAQTVPFWLSFKSKGIMILYFVVAQQGNIA